MLKVSRRPEGRPEIFYSIQGEGINMGKPAVFLRLGLCNLACIWCDTKYTWDWKLYDPGERIIEMSLAEVEREISLYNCRYLVITGGEPMLQHGQLVPLLEHLNDQGYYLEVETNGTIVPVPELVAPVDHWNVSPKLANSRNPPASREVPEALEFFSRLPSSHFKFVVENEADLAEVRSFLQRYGVSPERAILMPQAKDRQAHLRRSRWLVERCKDSGYLFSPRLQVLLWGSREAV